MRYNTMKYFAVLAVLAIFAVGRIQASEDASDESSIKDKIIAALNPSKAAYFALDRIDLKSSKIMYDVYKECLSGCWKSIMNEEDRNKCIASKKKKCDKVKNQKAKDLLKYYATSYAEGKAIEKTKSKVSSVLHLKVKEKIDDSDKTFKERLVKKGIKIATSAAQSKATDMALDAGKKAVKNAIFKS